MTKKLQTRFEIAAWDEKPYREFDDGRKFTRAEVTLKGAGDGLDGEATWDALMYYAADGTATAGSDYTAGTQTVTFTPGQTSKAVSFVLTGEGTYDGKTAHIASTVVPGSGTDALAGITGTSESVSTHEDYPHWPMTLTYDVE